MRKFTVLNDRKNGFKEEFQHFLEENLEKKYIPQYYPYIGYRADYTLLGNYMDVFVRPEILGITRTCFLRQPDDIPYEQWVESIPLVNTWVIKATKRIFYPDRMLRTTLLTDNVNKRVCVSELDHMNLPHHVLDEFFDNLQFLYFVRKNVFDEYYYKKLLNLPFY